MAQDQSDDISYSFHLNEMDVRDIETAYREGGTAKFAQLLQDRNDQWKTVPLHVAVIGCSGAGKSTYINCARNITADDPGAAATGVVETTAVVASYPHPDNDKLLYWDLPGVGTPDFLQENYLQKINFDKYDFYLLLSSTRFTENDLWLANKIKEAKKRFFFVRTKLDNEVSNYFKAHPKRSKGKTSDDILKVMRDDIVKKLHLGDHTTDVFLIDSLEPEKFEFWNLQLALLNGLPELKREAFLYSLSPMATLSKIILQKKITMLRERIWKLAMTSGLIGLVPIPGISIAVDLMLVLNEGKFYAKQLGLDDQSLQATADAHSIDIDHLRDVVTKILPGIVSTSLTKEFGMTLFQELTKEISGQAVEELLRFIPLVGSLVAAPLSIVLTRSALTSLLNKMETASNKVIDVCVDNVRQKALEDGRLDCEDLKQQKPAQRQRDLEAV